MKKHLIAAAVAGAFAVPAMAQVTIGGTLIYDLMNTQKVEKQDTSTAAKTTVKDTQTGHISARNWTASQLQFSATEDLGGGLRASAVTTVDLRGEGSTGFTRDQNLALAGGFGTVRVGKFIPAAATGFQGFSGIASTTVGSIYGLAASPTAGDGPLVPVGTAGAAVTSVALTAGSFERNSNLIQYTSPSISGLTVNVNIGQDSTDTSATVGKRETKQQGIGLSYAAGPLSVGLGMNEREMNSESTATPASGAKVKGELSWVGASYNLGVASVSVAQVQREDKSTAQGTGVVTTNADVSVTSLGITVPMGAMTFNVGMYDGENKGTASATDNTDLSGYQASVRYALSKRTTVYALIGENEIKRASGNTANASRTVSGNMIGLMHTF